MATCRQRRLLVAATLLSATLPGVLTLAGKPPAPAPMTNPAIAYEAWNHGAGIVLVTANGMSRKQLTTPQANGRDTSPVWSPDGKRIAFLRSPDYYHAPASLYMINSDGTGLKEVPPPYGGGGIIWSPDGAFLSRGLDILDLQSGTWASLSTADGIIGSMDDGRVVVMGYPCSFGPDLEPAIAGFQGYIAMGGGLADPTLQSGESALIVLYAEITSQAGNVDIQYGDFFAFPFGFDNPAFSPDLSMIAFISDTQHLNIADVLQDPVTGDVVLSEPRMICDWADHCLYPYGFDGRPTWSPDGAWLAFSACSGPVKGGGVYIDTYRIRPDGSGFTAITSTSDTESAKEPNWNPRWTNDLGQ